MPACMHMFFIWEIEHLKLIENSREVQVSKGKTWLERPTPRALADGLSLVKKGGIPDNQQFLPLRHDTLCHPHHLLGHCGCRGSRCKPIVRYSSQKLNVKTVMGNGCAIRRPITMFTAKAISISWIEVLGGKHWLLKKIVFREKNWNNIFVQYILIQSFA